MYAHGLNSQGILDIRGDVLSCGCRTSSGSLRLGLGLLSTFLGHYGVLTRVDVLVGKVTTNR